MKDRKMKGLSPQPDRAKNFDSVINMSDANYDKCTSSKWFVLDGGKARLKTTAEVAEMEAAELKSTAKAVLKETRNDSLMACTVEVNGNVFQTRPSDEANFRLAIAGLADGEVEGWILEDDTVVDIPKADLITVYGLGLQKIGAIYADYKAALLAL
jgi:hypothetical protein